MMKKDLIASVNQETGITNESVFNLCYNICNQEEENRFGGVFSCDTIPYEKFVNTPYFNIILNLAEIKKGELNGHFVSIIGTPDVCIYIDPFGLPIASPKIRKFLSACKRTILYNQKTIQQISSPYCGMYAILFCVFF